MRFVKELLTFSAEGSDPRSDLMLGVLGSFLRGVYAGRDGKSAQMKLLAATTRVLGELLTMPRTFPIVLAATPSTRAKLLRLIVGTGSTIG